MGTEADAGDVDVIRCRDVRALDPANSDKSSNALLYDKAHAERVKQAVARLIRSGAGRSVLKELTCHVRELAAACRACFRPEQKGITRVPPKVFDQWLVFRRRRAGFLIEHMMNALAVPCGFNYDQLREVRDCCGVNEDYPGAGRAEIKAALEVVRWRIRKNKLDPFPPQVVLREHDHTRRTSASMESEAQQGHSLQESAAKVSIVLPQTTSSTRKRAATPPSEPLKPVLATSVARPAWHIAKLPDRLILVAKALIKYGVEIEAATLAAEIGFNPSCIFHEYKKKRWKDWIARHVGWDRENSIYWWCDGTPHKTVSKRSRKRTVKRSK